MGRKKKVKRKIDELSDKYKKFVLYYIQLQNATKSYLQTYPHVKYSTAMTEGCKLLRKPKIKEAIQEHMDGIFKEKEKAISNMFNKLLSITDVDIADFIDENGNLKFKDFQEMNTYAISEYSKIVNETENSRNVKQTIKTMDKQKAIAELVKILGMVTDKTEVSGTIVVGPAIRPKENEDEEKPKRKYVKKDKDTTDGLNVQIALRPEEE